MKIELNGKRVLVTGGNSGLGAATARAFAAAGAHVAINHLVRAEATEELVRAFTAGGGRAIGLLADISDPTAVETMFGRMDDERGGIDVLVNNAGIDGAYAKGWEGEAADWFRVIDINLPGAYLCAREALRRMVPQRSGVILNISSVHEVIAWTGYSAYSASKAGVSMMSKTLAQEAAPHGVRVLCIAPGAIQTPINQTVWSDPESMRDLLSKIPLSRIGRRRVAGLKDWKRRRALRRVTGHLWVSEDIFDFENKEPADYYRVYFMADETEPYARLIAVHGDELEIKLWEGEAFGEQQQRVQTQALAEHSLDIRRKYHNLIVRYSGEVEFLLKDWWHPFVFRFKEWSSRAATRL